MEISWYNANQLEELAYDCDGLIDVISDACLNENLSPNPESIVVALKAVQKNLEEIRSIVEDTFADHRLKMMDKGEEEELEDEELEEKKLSGTFEVVQSDENVFTVKGSDEDMERLMSASITSALIRGIETIEKENEAWVELRAAAEELERFLRVWEESDELDYDPEVKEKREALTRALNK